MQSRFLMGFVAGAIAVAAAWFFLTNHADPTGAAIGFKGGDVTSNDAAEPTHDGRGYGYMLFHDTTSDGGTLFVINDGEQPDGL
ncbi:MAG: hypothetical protein QF464_12975, partial [Myxococcota bacterium]|nr:hypothetical protein [Myxococcota bacterium]